MKKSMYSLILIDEVVAAVDRLAREQGTSRSNLINQVLAEHLHLLTPQQRVEQVFQALAEAACRDSAVQLQATSGSTLTLRSALNFRYNPTIRYSVEIALDGEGGYAGAFKVVSRTQSGALLSRLGIFYELWSQIEQSCLDGRLDRPLGHRIAGAQFRRSLRLGQEGRIEDAQQLGRAIGDYIRLFDRALGLYFEATFGVDIKTFQEMQALYEAHIASCELLV